MKRTSKGTLNIATSIISMVMFVVLGFSCNQFGAQEPDDISEIQTFCSFTYDVSFPLFAKINVNGDDATPLYKHLKSAAPGLLGSEAIKWNFTKFFSDREGNVLNRYAHQPNLKIWKVP